MIVKANAKVNFTLEVLGKRSDGYHDLRSVVVPVSLADEIELVPAEKTVLEIADEKGFLRGVDCGGEKNLAVKGRLLAVGIARLGASTACRHEAIYL